MLLRIGLRLLVDGTGDPAKPATTIEVVPLDYAKAEEVAYTLSGIAPPGVRVIPYVPTNSLLIAGQPEAVGQFLSVLRGKEKTAEGR